MKTPDQAVADVTARLRRSWPRTVADDELRRIGHNGGHEPGDGDQSAWPHLFPLGPPGRQDLEQHFAAYQAKTLAWRKWQATHGGDGVELLDATRRVHGTLQAIPTRLRVAGIDAAARLSGREWAARLARGRTRAAALLKRFMPPPDLPRMLREVDDWADVDFALLCDAAAWFRDNDATGLTPRQVPVPGMHAKWLNTRQHLVAALVGLDELPLAPAHPPRVHLTYLDPEHHAASGRRHDCISLGDHVQLPYTPRIVIISENKDTAVAFPAVAGGVCVEGGGFGGATAAALPWLVAAPLLVYWGDIDAAGYEILDGFRSDGVPAISMLMDLVTFERYERYGTSLDRHGNPLGPGTRRDLPHLDAAERTMYHVLTDPAWNRHWRIEQERIPLADALEALRLLQARKAVFQLHLMNQHTTSEEWAVENLPVKRIVCLANSRKMSGRCIAGYELVGERFGGWIRPVSSREHEEVALEEQRYENGEIPQLLDIIDVPLVTPRPRLHQPENWLLNPNFYWNKVGRFEVNRLSSLVDSQDPLWINGYHTYNGLNDEIPTNQLHTVGSSLKLISVSTVQIHVYRPGAAFGNPKRRIQAHFNFSGVDYRLWITDPLLEAQYLAAPDGVHTLGPCYLTVSIGEPYGENCYKLVAAVIGAAQ